MDDLHFLSTSILAHQQLSRVYRFKPVQFYETLALGYRVEPKVQRSVLHLTRTFLEWELNAPTNASAVADFAAFGPHHDLTIAPSMRPFRENLGRMKRQCWRLYCLLAAD